MSVSRRAFLLSASGAIGTSFLHNDVEKTFTELRAMLLDMVNEERAVAKVPLVEVDELATQVATKHAVEMAKSGFASHWGRDGFKPYHRYSFAGGTGATQENVSAADNTWSTKVADLKQDISYLHVRLYQETPPFDGHRRTILAPQHTHVGFGLAVDALRLRLVEVFVAKYLEVQPVPRVAKPGDVITFKAKLVNRDFTFSQLEVFYEPLPKEPELSWLRESRPYALPSESRVLRPRVLPPLVYADRKPGVIEMLPEGRFRSPVRFWKDEPGIYTIVAWILPHKVEKAFPATEVCIRVE